MDNYRTVTNTQVYSLPGIEIAVLPQRDQEQVHNSNITNAQVHIIHTHIYIEICVLQISNGAHNSPNLE